MSNNQRLAIPQTAYPDWDRIGGIDPEFRLARFNALSASKLTFDYFCGTCIGIQKHDVRFGSCLACSPVAARALRAGESPERIQARRLGHRHYRSHCETCGPAAFWTKTGQCSDCRTVNGTVRNRVPMPAARRVALDDGASTYSADCVLHGRVAHHSRRGLCLSCYDTLGTPRDEVYMRFCKLCRTVTPYARQTRCCILCE